MREIIVLRNGIDKNNATHYTTTYKLIITRENIKTFMKAKPSNSEKLITLVDNFPEFCYGFFFDTVTTMALSTRVAYAQDLQLFFSYLIDKHPHFCIKEMKNITRDDMKLIMPEDINRFISQYVIDNNDASRKTAARKRASLSSFFHYLYNTLRIIERNPVDGAMRVKIPTKDYVEYLNFEEQEKLLNTVKYGTGLSTPQLKYHQKYAIRDYALFSLALDTGMRVSEMNGIDIQDLDLDRCSVIIQRKGGKSQMLFFSDEIRDNLQEYLNEKYSFMPYTSATEPLFTTLKGNRLSIRQMEELVKKYVAAALPNRVNAISFHKMRSSYAMETYAAEPDLLKLQKKLGHSQIAATNVYAKASDKTLEDGRNLLQNTKKQLL